MLGFKTFCSNLRAGGWRGPVIVIDGVFCPDGYLYVTIVPLDTNDN